MTYATEYLSPRQRDEIAQLGATCIAETLKHIDNDYADGVHAELVVAIDLALGNVAYPSFNEWANHGDS